jgi:hypothetical protein
MQWPKRPMVISGLAANSVYFASMAFMLHHGAHLPVSIFPTGTLTPCLSRATALFGLARLPV